jgi:hypothetical protein
MLVAVGLGVWVETALKVGVRLGVAERRVFCVAVAVGEGVRVGVFVSIPGITEIGPTNSDWL